jgi:hypothetical protein
MPTPHETAERRRCQRLHQAFLDLQSQHRAGGKRLNSLIRALSHRMLRGPYEPYSVSSIRRLYDRWKLDPAPETLAHRYKPGKPSIPSSITNMVLRRMRANPAMTVREALEKTRAAWLFRYTRRGASPKPFPASLASIGRHIAARLPISWTEQRRRRRAVLAETARLDAMIADALLPHQNHKPQNPN